MRGFYLNALALMLLCVVKSTKGTCDKVCPRHLNQVCDQYGKMYANQCLFEIAKCNNPKLKLVDECDVPVIPDYSADYSFDGRQLEPDEVQRIDERNNKWKNELDVATKSSQMSLYGVVPMDDTMKKKAAITYLLKFGFVMWRESTSMRIPGSKTFQKVLKEFQHFAGIQSSGKLDDVTLSKMKLPRCGLPDYSPRQRYDQKKRGVVVQGTKWKSKRLLTWKVEEECKSLPRDRVQKVLQKAFALWSAVADLKFREGTASEEVDIRIKFVEGSHQDYYRFDGKHGTLAHAFYPNNELTMSGDIHFDNSEKFTDKKGGDGVDLLWLATHQIGHSIGLAHSSLHDSIMTPWQKESVSGSNTNEDDANAIQSIYGKPKGGGGGIVSPMATSVPQVVIPNDRVCPRTIEAVYYNSYAGYTILTTKLRNIFFMKGEKNIKFGPIKRKAYIGYKRIPLQITAAFSTRFVRKRKDIHVIFSGPRYYFYQHMTFRDGPFSIYSGSKGNKTRGRMRLLGLTFPRSVRQIDAVMTWPRNGRTYFFAGSLYWRFNNKGNRFDEGYPKSISTGWPGIPDNLDAAFASKKFGLTYFVKNKKLYKINDRTLRIEPGYPEPIGYRWLNCGGISSLPAKSTKTRNDSKGVDDFLAPEP